ncbi:hypothetical protein D3C78_1869840 [compost metagenome]
MGQQVGLAEGVTTGDQGTFHLGVADDADAALRRRRWADRGVEHGRGDFSAVGSGVVVGGVVAAGGHLAEHLAGRQHGGGGS